MAFEAVTAPVYVLLSTGHVSVPVMFKADVIKAQTGGEANPCEMRRITFQVIFSYKVCIGFNRSCARALSPDGRLPALSFKAAVVTIFV